VEEREVKETGRTTYTERGFEASREADRSRVTTVPMCVYVAPMEATFSWPYVQFSTAAMPRTNVLQPSHGS
jgi:hypothetical protein